MLRFTVEVAGNRSGAHVRLFSDRRIAEVREVADLDAASQIRFLDLDEVADVDPIAQPSLPAQMRERPDPDVVANRRVGDDALANGNSIAERGVRQAAVGPDDAVPPDARKPSDRCIRIYDGV